MDQAAILGMTPTVLEHITVRPIYAQSRENAGFSWSVVTLAAIAIIYLGMKVA